MEVIDDVSICIRQQLRRNIDGKTKKMPLTTLIIHWIEGVGWESMDRGRARFRINDHGHTISKRDHQTTKLYSGKSQLRQQVHDWFATHFAELYGLCACYHALEIEIRIQENQLDYIFIDRITRHRPDAPILHPAEVEPRMTKIPKSLY